MKKFIFLSILSCLAFTLKVYSQANTSLSNLVAPTDINANLVPATNNTITLGGNAKRFNYGYFNNTVTTNFRLGTASTAGYVLTTDVAGNGTWQALPTLSSPWVVSGTNLYYNTGNVGIGNTNPTAKFHLTGAMKIDGTNFLEFGGGLTKQSAAGRIAYQLYSNDALDIVGAGTTIENRKIKFFNNGGATFIGPISAPSLSLTTGAGAGKVLTSDASGNATWQMPAASGGSSQWTTTGSNIHYSTGNVGIGASATSSKLFVKGEFKISNAVDINGMDGLVLERIDESNRIHQWKFWHMNQAYGKNDLELWEYAADGSGSTCGGNGNDGAICGPRLTVQAVTGNMGIGTKPLTALDVNGKVMTRTRFTMAAGDPLTTKVWNLDNSNNDLRFFQEPNINTAGSVSMIIKDDGSVGIGTTTPSAKLHTMGTFNVSGSEATSHFNYSVFEDTYIRGGKYTSNVIIGDIGNKVIVGSVPSTPGDYKMYVANGILTEKVKVAIKTTANWSDHVFADDYDLKPLTDVETFICENKHLPEIPSANEVVANGIDLAEMNAKLLQKIEELTLYVIDLNKKNEELTQRVSSLEK